MSVTMKVYAALQEVKLLQKKIEKASYEKVMPAAVSYSNGVIKVGHINSDVKTYIAEQEASLQSQLDLQARVLRIRATIAEANCDTITIAGKPYKVYEALLLKEDSVVKSRRNMISTMKADYLKVRSQYDSLLEKAENEAYAQSKAYLEGAGRVTIEDVKRAVATSSPTESVPDMAISVYTKFFEQNKPICTEIHGDALKLINQMEDELDEFLKEVDIKITEFNMTKEITIED